MAEQLLTDITQLRRSPLAHRAQEMAAKSTIGERGVALREIAFLNMIGIRATPATSGADALSTVTGLPWPSGHGQVTGNAEGVAILWLGPEEFLLVSSDETAVPEELIQQQDREPGALISLATHPLAVQLSQAMARSRSSGQVVDLSANRTTLELAGPSARAVLEKGCHVDLHPRVFGPGNAVSTTLGPVQVMLWQTKDRTYWIMPRASFADYTATWLLDAMTEFASAEVP